MGQGNREFTGNLFFISTKPVLSVLLLSSIGALCARKPRLFPPESRRLLSSLIYYVFVPALIIDTLSKSVSAEAITQWWPLVLSSVLSVLVGLAAGLVIAHITRCDPKFKRLLCAVCGLSNVGNLPLVLVVELAEDSKSILFGLGEQAISYVAVSLVLSTVTHFILGYHLLKRKDSDSNDHHDAINEEATMKKTGKLAQILRDIFTPPTIASIVGIGIGLCEPVKDLFFLSKRIDGDLPSPPPLSVIRNTVRSLAGAAIPSMMIVLGAHLTRGPPKESQIGKGTLFSVVVFKLLISPAIGAGFFGFWNSHRWFPVPDEAFAFVLLLMWAMPSALNLLTLSTLSNYAQAELSSMLFYQYMASFIILPFVIFLFLWLAEEMI